MIKFFYVVFSLILVVKTISDAETERKFSVDGSILSDESSKSSLDEIATDFTTILSKSNKESDRIRRSPVQLRDNSNSESESQDNSFEREAVEEASITDFDDLEKEGRSGDNDSIDEERIAKELETDETSKIGKTEPPVFIDSVTRTGDNNLKTEIDNADWSHGSSDETRDSGYTERRQLVPTNKFLHDSTLIETLPNLFPIYNHNFGQFLNPLYSSTTAYHPSTNWLNTATFNQFPKAQISNPYNFNDRPNEYKNLYDTSNRYPYIGHINTAPMPLLPNMFANIRPHDFSRIMPGPNSYGSTNFEAQQFDQRLVRNTEGN